MTQTTRQTNINPITGEPQSFAIIGTEEERNRVGTESSVDRKTLLVLEPGPIMHRVLDARDAEIAQRRIISSAPLPEVGDWLDFSDGSKARIAHVWPPASEAELVDCPEWKAGVQPAKGGSFYLGELACSFSGSLDPSIPLERLTLTDKRRDGPCWIFHHDYKYADNGVDFLAPFRVWRVAS